MGQKMMGRNGSEKCEARLNQRPLGEAGGRNHSEKLERERASLTILTSYLLGIRKTISYSNTKFNRTPSQIAGTHVFIPRIPCHPLLRLPKSSEPRTVAVMIVA